MTVSITPLAQSLIVGDLPRSGATRVRTLEQAATMDAPINSWARTAKPLSDIGHYLYQKLSIDPRTVDQWTRNIADTDPAQHYRRARDYVLTVYGSNTWAQIDQMVSRIQHGDMSALGEITVVENHAESNPSTTRLSVCDDYVSFFAAAICGLNVVAWVGFSAVRHDVLRAHDQAPTMCGLTIELARKAH